MSEFIKTKIAEASVWCEINLMLANSYALNGQPEEAKKHVARAENESEYAFSLAAQK